MGLPQFSAGPFFLLSFGKGCNARDFVMILPRIFLNSGEKQP